MMKNVIDAIDLRTTSGKKLEIEPPVKAPSKLAKTRAEEDPRKTANGLFEVPLIHFKVVSALKSRKKLFLGQIGLQFFAS